MATPDYSVNYDDKRFTEVEADKRETLSDLEQTYTGMINNSDKFYQQQIDAANKYAETQKKNQQAQTDFAIEQIEQQKDQAKQDYTKEQSGAYVDWQKQSNQYGANAEQIAAQGMADSGYSESSQVSMYNTYQNRVSTAREAYMRAVLNYDNAIKDARLQNNAALAEIAYNALQKQLELSLEGFQYKNTLILNKSNKKLELESEYHDRYQDVLAQINTENALAEEVRQHNESLAEEQRQYNESLAMEQEKLEEEQRQYNASLALQREQFNWQKAQSAAKSSSSSSSSKASGSSSVKKSSSKKSSGSAVNKGASSAASAAVNAVKSAKSTKSSTKSFSGSTYEAAVSYMNQNGVPNSYASNVMTKREWQGRKSSYSYKTYTAYLKDYTQYAVENLAK